MLFGWNFPIHAFESFSETAYADETGKKCKMQRETVLLYDVQIYSTLKQLQTYSFIK